MIVDQHVETRWNSRTKKYYEELGYEYTKMGDSIFVLVSDLKFSSCEKVKIECDYCGNQYGVRWASRTANLARTPIKKDACDECKHIKASETLFFRYGDHRIMYIQEFKDKLTNTFLEKYGVENPFESDEIKKKIIETNLKKYGKPHYNQTKESQEKRKSTMFEKYGVEHIMHLSEYQEKMTGSNHPSWKGGVRHPRWDRLQPPYKEWRDSVYGRDRYTCQKCLQHSNKLEAHHILNWNDFENERYNVSNGITFCQNCHIEFHREYGKKKNNSEQLSEFLQKR